MATKSEYKYKYSRCVRSALLSNQMLSRSKLCFKQAHRSCVRCAKLLELLETFPADTRRRRRTSQAKPKFGCPKLVAAYVWNTGESLILAADTLTKPLLFK